MTLTRTLINLQIMSSGGGSFGVQLFDFAIGVADQEAFAASVLPDPVSSSDEPMLGWVYRTRTLITREAATTAANQVMHIQADIRSRRKIDDGELYFSMSNTAFQGGSFTVLFGGIIRCLFLSP